MEVDPLHLQDGARRRERQKVPTAHVKNFQFMKKKILQLPLRSYRIQSLSQLSNAEVRLHVWFAAFIYLG